MSDHDDLIRRVLDDIEHDEEQRRDGPRPDPTVDLDDFARRAFNNH